MESSIARALAAFRLRRKFGAAAEPRAPKSPKKRPSLPRKARPASRDRSSAGDSDRRLWVLNDEPLYRAWQASGEPLEHWIATHRKQIDAKRLPRRPGSVRVRVASPRRPAPSRTRRRRPRPLGRYRLQEKHQGRWATVEHYTHAADARAAYKRAVRSGKGREAYRLLGPSGKVLGRATAKSTPKKPTRAPKRTKRAPKRTKRPAKRRTTKRTKR